MPKRSESDFSLTNIDISFHILSLRLIAVFCFSQVFLTTPLSDFWQVSQSSDYLKFPISPELFEKKQTLGVPRWLSQPHIQLLVSAQVTILGSWDLATHQKPCSVWSLTDILSLPLPLPLPPPAHVCSLSKINKIFTKKKKGKRWILDMLCIPSCIILCSEKVLNTFKHLLSNCNSVRHC